VPKNSPPIFRGIQYMKKQVTRPQGSDRANRSDTRPRQRVRPMKQAVGTAPGTSEKPFSSKVPRKGAGPRVPVAAAYASGQRSTAPQIAATRDQVRIVHRELLASVSGSTAFAVPQSIALNPGLSASFPWLSSQAQSWERYRFNKLRFCYYTRTGSNVPGSVQMVPDYDAADAAPVSEQVASSYEDVEEDAPWKDICCELRPSALHALGPTKFIRLGALLANQDIKTYDAGNFFLATTDGTNVAWGKLWVEYDVTLYTPQLPPGGGGALQALDITGVTPTTASILGTQTIKSNSSALATVLGNVVTFNQAGQYSVWYYATSTSDTVSGNPAVSAGSSFTAGPVSAGSGAALTAQVMLVQMLAGGTLTFNNTVVAGGIAELVIAQVPANLG
jgi:hypothetical protein